MQQVALESGEEVVRAYKEHRLIDAVLHVYCCVNGKSAAHIYKGHAGSAQDATGLPIAAV
ncbi:MAG: hypothetical protein QF515_13300 [Pseudomonadales bacterium]|jgi:hypothetical protein|nr:hypothetical protein [Pseudomonadales bacterium]MDP6828066.1 hypothetical protein [Pseudomonadales bacterium]|tara:strand:- start:1125 stop:1304 length:180 start_codon:yes stop_codon:yes gene_type:complete